MYKIHLKKENFIKFLDSKYLNCPESFNMSFKTHPISSFSLERLERWALVNLMKFDEVKYKVLCLVQVQGNQSPMSIQTGAE